MRTHRTDMRWLWRGVALALLVIGWTFIAFANNFHISPAVVFIGLGYLAAIATIWNLWQTGASAVASNEEDAGDVDWGRPIGPRDELEREKRTLLKAIKEAEFDHHMGKLSDADAEKMIQTYRARAIQVIRELEEPGLRGTIRDAIEREVRVRLEVEAHRKPAAKKKSKKAAEAAAKAARAAAAAGAPGQVAAKLAAAAAQAAEDEEAKDTAKDNAEDTAKDTAKDTAEDTIEKHEAGEPGEASEPAGAKGAKDAEVAEATPEPVEPAAAKEAIR